MPGIDDAIVSRIEDHFTDPLWGITVRLNSLERALPTHYHVWWQDPSGE